VSAVSTDWNDDDQLLAELGEAVRAGDTLPAGFIDLGRAAFAWRDVDADLAALTLDSADAPADALRGVRSGPAALRSMTFVGRELTVELEIHPDAVVGQVAPPTAGQLELRLRDGRTRTVPVDEVGWFTIRPRPAGLFSLRLRTAAGTDVVTEWTALQP
jgi:hypothetical protein